MLSLIRGWIEHRKEIREHWKRDARQLIDVDERGAYYAAQRLAARSRAQGDWRGFSHWAKVAAEVARISRLAEMDLNKVREIVDAELTLRR
jgi:hypothetical protein